MSENVYLVFSNPPEGLDADEYGRWYEGHTADILAVEGFAAARRFNLAAIRGDTSPTMYSHLALYEIDGDPREAMGRLAAATESGAVPRPHWFDAIRFASFYGSALEGPIDLDRLDHLYAVFSKPPDAMPLDEFVDWYHTHTRENLTADGFDAVWRYRLEADTIDPLAPADAAHAAHAALYEVHGELPQLRAALKAAADAGRVGFPEWFDRIQFGSLDCHAASPALTPA